VAAVLRTIFIVLCCCYNFSRFSDWVAGSPGWNLVHSRYYWNKKRKIPRAPYTKPLNFDSSGWYIAIYCLLLALILLLCINFTCILKVLALNELMHLFQFVCYC